MKYGIQLAMGAAVCGATPLKRVAATAEELGYDSILMGDHIMVPKRIDTPWPYRDYVEGDAPYEVYTDMPVLDAFDTVAFLAALTKKVRLGFSVLIVPYRHPFDLARQVATIDVLSEGRLIFGVAVGWLEEEFRLLGIPFKERAPRTREYMELLKTLWTEEKPRFEGKFVSLREDVNLEPRPIQKPYPPVWVGGESVPALKRVAAFGNGWHIGLVTPDRIRPGLEKLRQLMDEAGRDFAQLEITALADPTRLKPEDVSAYEEMGLSVLYMLPIAQDASALIDQMHSFAETVKSGS